MQSYVTRIETAVRDLQNGKMVILMDDPDRENEGDLIFPAEKITTDVINFMVRHCSGIICLPLTPDLSKKIGLTMMVPPHENSNQHATPFTVSIEAKKGVTTGVSSKDRVTTILTAIQDDACADDIARPGHVFPLQAKVGGVLERAGHTEGTTDLMRIAGLKSAGVLCEVMNEDGSQARGEQLQEFAKKYDLHILSVNDIIAYRLSKEDLIEEEVTSELPTELYGTFKISVFREKISGVEHTVLSKESITPCAPLLVRVHSSCMTGDIFGSTRCDCNKQLHYSLERLGQEGGMLIYLNQEGRGIGLFNKIKTYALQEKGMDTVEANHELNLPADSRKYYIAANVLRNNKINDVRLLTNNPAKIEDLKKYGISNVTREAMPIFLNDENKNYLQTKKSKLNHIIDFD